MGVDDGVISYVCSFHIALFRYEIDESTHAFSLSGLLNRINDDWNTS